MNFIVIHRKTRKAQVVHVWKTAAAITCLQIYECLIYLIYWIFVQLSTVFGDPYYYNYIFIKLLMNN